MSLYRHQQPEELCQWVPCRVLLPSTRTTHQVLGLRRSSGAGSPACPYQALRLALHRLHRDRKVLVVVTAKERGLPAVGSNPFFIEFHCAEALLGQFHPPPQAGQRKVLRCQQPDRPCDFISILRILLHERTKQGHPSPESNQVRARRKAPSLRRPP